MKLPPYPKYKPSGVEWLGDVPEHWEIDRLKWTTVGTVNGTWAEEPNGDDYFEREVLQHVPDAWIDESKTKVCCENPLNRRFYRYGPPRPLEVIEGEIQQLEREILVRLADVTGSSEVQQ